MNRNLDGVYFRVQRNDGFESVCFSDLTGEEQDKIMEGKNEQWLKSMCKILGGVIRRIGDQLDLIGEVDDEEE